MLINRRKFIKSALAIAAYGSTFANGFLHSAQANTQWLKDRFKPGTYEQTIAYLFNGAEIVDSHKIKFFRLPHVAENGAVVPIKIATQIKNVEKIYILVEKNPHPLSAEFSFSTLAVPQVSARLKMAETSDVIVIVEAEGKYYRKSKKVKVTIGGCG